MIDFIKQYPIILTSFFCLFLFICIYFIAYKNKHYNSTSVVKDKDENIRIKRERFERVYSPLQALFLETHMLVVETIPYRDFQSKINRVGLYFRTGRVSRGIKLLFQKNKLNIKLDPSIGYLAVNEIGQIVESNRDFCDRRLFYLYKEMKNKSKGAEFKEPDDLNAEDKRLVMYILEAYDKLKEELS